jgi:hypothetical protein
MRKILLMLSMLAGCTVIGHTPPPPDWPALRVVEHRVSSREMADVCYAHVEVPMWMRLAGANLEGCALVYFDKGECHVWVRGDFPDPLVLEHERMHCRGHDHIGSSDLADAWREFKRGRR